MQDCASRTVSSPPGPSRRSRGWLAGLVVLMTACGGGGTAFNLYPLWIPTSVAVSDIDGNGWPDIVTTAYVSPALGVFEGRVKVRRQLSAGSFSTAEEYAAGQTPWMLKVADVDGDGHGDLLVGEPSQVWSGITRPGRVWWLRQNPSQVGSFLPAVALADGYNVYDLDVADMTGDGVPDIAFGDATKGSDRVLVLPQDPMQRGVFGAVQSIPMPGPVSRLAAKDVNDDTRVDLVTAYTSLTRPDYSYDTSLGLTLNTGSGFGATTQLTTFAYGSAAHLAVTDFNSDGRLDVAAYFSRFDERAVPTIRVLPQGAGGTWGPPVDTPVPVDALKGRDGQVVADLNGDGRPDFAFVGFYPEGTTPDGFSIVRSDLTLLPQTPDGHFTLGTRYEMPMEASRIGAGDINRNGRQDLVVYGTRTLPTGGNVDQVLLLMQSGTAAGTFLSPVTVP